MADVRARRAQLARLRVLAEKAVRAYDLGPARLTLIQHEENTTYLVTAAKDRFVLRIHRPPLRTAQTVSSELRWLQALAEGTSLAIPQPVPTADGALLVQASGPGLTGSRICVLFRWLPGRFLEVGLTPQHLRQVGRLAAHLQEHARAWSAPSDFRRPRLGLITEGVRAGEAAGVLERQAREEPTLIADPDRACVELETVVGPQGVRPVRELLDRVLSHRAALGTGPAVYGLQHGDLHQENYLFHHGTIGVIDFDDCGFGWYIDDLAVTASEIQGRPDTAELLDALIDGYGAPVDRPALELHIAFRYLQIAVWKLSLRSTFPDTWQADVEGLVGAIARRVG